MRLRRLAAAVAVFALAGTGIATAHHGWGSYDSGHPLTLTGTIREPVYENPHTGLKLETKDKAWVVVLAPPGRMRNRNLTPELMTAGKTATVYGYPHKTDTSELRAEWIQVDGVTTLLR
jgi:hypothetical protein